VFLGKAVQTVNPPNGSVGLSQLSATGTKDATTFLRGDNTFASAGGTNTPAFLANLSGDQTISDSSYTKLTMNTEIFDDGGCFDSSSNYRFTPTTAGKYYVYVKGRYISQADYDNNVFNIFKNGSNYAEARNTNRYYDTCFIGVIIDFNGSSDYVEAYTQHTSGANEDIQGGTTHQARSEFGAFKIIQ